ncbi:hypothetical protein D3C75_605690 [compost metagenome]
MEELQLVFNPRLDLEHFDDPIETLVKDYDVTLTLADGSGHTVAVRDNYLALNRHRLAARGVVRLRLDFRAAWGSPFYEVFAVKLYAPGAAEVRS